MPARLPVTLSAKQVATLVTRPVLEVSPKDGALVEKQVAVKADEVLTHAEYDDGTLVVVTVDGQKFFGTVPAAAKK